MWGMPRAASAGAALIFSSDLQQQQAALPPARQQQLAAVEVDGVLLAGQVLDQAEEVLEVPVPERRQ
jgi:hypothetical protein